MPAIPMNNSRNVPDDDYGTNFTSSKPTDDRTSLNSTYRSDKTNSLDGSVNTSGTYRRGGNNNKNIPSSRDSRSGSDFYSEDDSDNDYDNYADAAGHLLSATQRSNATRLRHSGTKEDFLRSVDGHGSQNSNNNNNNNNSSSSQASSPTSRPASTARRGTTGSIGVNRMSLSDCPLSYFHTHNSSAFSIRNELRCYFGHLRHLYKTVEEDRLPWKTDFADLQKMRFPRKMKEIAGRLNLNIPYYSSNYIEVFYVVTMPFLFFYNTPFFLVTFITMVMIHSVTMRRKNTKMYGESVTFLGRPISYRKLAHIQLLAFTMLFMFFDGLKTLLWVIVLNLSVIVPHAVIRKPTYFDDEELEKCRPKLAQYAVVLLMLALDYLEGDVRDHDETMSRRLVEREKKRLAAVLEKREGKD